MAVFTLIGSGNVAWWFAGVMVKTGHTVKQVYSRNMSHAQALANTCEAEAIDLPARLRAGSDGYLFALSDHAYSEILPLLPFRLPVAIHTAGMLSRDIFSPYAENYGVIYPCQTLSRVALMNNPVVPLCVEGHNKSSETMIWKWANQWSSTCCLLPETERQYLHLSAVFASNFPNILYAIAFNILKINQLSPFLLMPLIQNSIQQLQNFSPEEIQTGPAIRKDKETMKKHLNLLTSTRWKEIYIVLSKEIEKMGKDIKKLP
ncbi:MAG: DUF2520 domain-containing protein [Bacteroidales bacterium]|jgi:predicted short-subunit dehydrogenase-like oxidoreductase (DUF2520 family)|nr:DUF2520 domain-containing protein [Bacteroidales bacterium]